MTESSTPTLSNEQLGEVLRLIKGSDTVELKLTVPDGDHASAVAALEMDVLDAQIRQVVFFDTPDLTLNQHGVVVRGRRVQGRDGDTVVKLRPIDPADVPAKVRKDPGFGIEVDAMPGGFVCSGSMKATLDDYRVKETFAGSRPLSKLLTGEQRRFFADHAPRGWRSTTWPGWVRSTSSSSSSRPASTAASSSLNCGSTPTRPRLLELSTKCAPSEAFQVAAETKTFLAGRGIDLSGVQATKTRMALDYFAGQLAAAPS